MSATEVVHRSTMGWKRSGVALFAGVFMARAAIADPSDDVVRARFTTDASAQDVATNACAITRAFPINNRARTWDVVVGGRRCSSRPADPDAIPLLVVITSMDARTSVTLEASPSEDVPADALKREVTATGSALRDLHSTTQPTTTQQGRGNLRQGPTKGGNSGAVTAVAVAAGGVAAGVTVAIVVVVVAVVSGFVALFTALAKAL